MGVSLSRRDLLAAFLGVPLAVEACKRRPRIPDGEMAFRPDELGHRLRDEPVPTLPPDRWRNAEVVIVGGGVAGLAAAWHLTDAGVTDIVLLELEGRPGGTARSGANATSAFPWGAHYITAPMKHNDPLVRFLDGLGLVERFDAAGEPVFREDVLCREPQERIHVDGHWHDGLFAMEAASEDDKRQFARFRTAMEAAAGQLDDRGRRAFAVPTAFGAAGGPALELDAMSMADWLTREGFDAPRLRWLVDYACRDDFGARLAQTSAWAGTHYYASRIAAAGRDPQPVLTWPEGNGWLVSKLADRVRDKVRTGLAAVDVNPAPGGVDVVAIGRAPEALGFHARHVVFAAPQYVAARVIRPWRDARPAHLDHFKYGAWMVANLTLSKRPRERRGRGGVMAWDNVLYESDGLGYVVATHQSGRDYGPTVLTYYRPLCDEDPSAARRKLYAAGRDEWADVVMADLERAHPDIREVTERLDVVRWGHAMVRPGPGFFTSPHRAAAAKPLRGIHFANTDLSGIALFEEAFFHGTRAAVEVLAARGPA